MTWFEEFWHLLTGRIPKRFGKQIRFGVYYDTYHNSKTGKTFVCEKTTGRFFER